jgi:membrane protein YqaA with SNARE-associated domain
VTRLLPSFLGFFLTWWGALLLGALDSTVLVFAPLGTDALVIYLAARHRELFWLYPLLTTAGSTAGAALTYWIGAKAGDVGLERFVPGYRLERLKRRVRKTGAVALALPAVMPPPFPLTAFILTCGALEVSRWRFFLVFTTARFVRFGVEALLARRSGERVLRVIESATFQWFIMAFIVIAVAGTIVSAVALWRRTH